MYEVRRYACAICGEQRRADDRWFLVAENSWEDKLKVLQWDDRLASQMGIHHACGSSHVEELVVHWMVTGSLDYPFAQVSTGLGRSIPVPKVRATTGKELDTMGARQIGELSVHRESLQRALEENPRSLKAILDALLSALERDTKPLRKEQARDEEPLLCPVGQPG